MEQNILQEIRQEKSYKKKSDKKWNKKFGKKLDHKIQTKNVQTIRQRSGQVVGRSQTIKWDMGHQR